MSYQGQKFRLNAKTDLEFNAFDGVNPDGYHTVSFQRQENGIVAGCILHLKNASGEVTSLVFTSQL